MTQAQIRTGVLLFLTGAAGFCLIVGLTNIPHWNRWGTAGIVFYVLAYVYSQVTKSRGLM
jgi:hypothetical protein